MQYHDCSIWRLTRFVVPRFFDHCERTEDDDERESHAHEVDEARQQVAEAVGAHPTEVIFTSGGSPLRPAGGAWKRQPAMAAMRAARPSVRRLAAPSDGRSRGLRGRRFSAREVSSRTRTAAMTAAAWTPQRSAAGRPQDPASRQTPPARKSSPATRRMRPVRRRRVRPGSAFPASGLRARMPIVRRCPFQGRPAAPAAPDPGRRRAAVPGSRAGRAAA